MRSIIWPFQLSERTTTTHTRTLRGIICTAETRVARFSAPTRLKRLGFQADVFVVQDALPRGGLAEECAAEGHSHFVAASRNTHAANVNRRSSYVGRGEKEGEAERGKHTMRRALPNPTQRRVSRKGIRRFMCRENKHRGDIRAFYRLLFIALRVQPTLVVI